MQMPGELMYHRAVLEGMPAMEGGQRSDPKMFFGKDTYNYLMYWHTKTRAVMLAHVFQICSSTGFN
jgi:hypothetical protein